VAKETSPTTSLGIEIHELQRAAQLITGRLNLKGIVEGNLSGHHKSPRQGVSQDFAQYRDYVPGDDLKYLDWRAYAKSDRYVVKQYVEETNLRAFMVLDRSMSMNYCGGGLSSKGIYAARLAAALSWTLLSVGEAVGLVTFGHQIDRYLPAISRRDHFWRLLRELEVSPWQKETNAREALLRLPSRLPPKGVIFLLTDGFDLDESSSSGYFADAVGGFKQHGYQVVLLHILDPYELEFPFDELSLFEGLEGEDPIKIDPTGVRRAYLEELRAFQVSLEQEARAVGAKYCLCSSGQTLAHNLLRLLESAS
jgi:uncharacterized protein (DUF58 family)